MAEDNDGIRLSRRKALAGLGSIGAATALGGVGTWAQFTDTEMEQFTFTAGGVDGTMSVSGSYNGNSLSADLENVEDGVGAGWNFTDVKPGDYGCLLFELEVTNNPAWIASCIGMEDNDDGETFEPEIEVDADLPQNGPSFPLTYTDYSGDFDPGAVTLDCQGNTVTLEVDPRSGSDGLEESSGGPANHAEIFLSDDGDDDWDLQIRYSTASDGFVDYAGVSYQTNGGNWTQGTPSGYTASRNGNTLTVTGPFNAVGGSYTEVDAGSDSGVIHASDADKPFYSNGLIPCPGGQGELAQNLWMIPFYDSDFNCGFFDDGEPPADLSGIDSFAVPSAFWSNSEAANGVEAGDGYLAPRTLYDIATSVSSLDTKHWNGSFNTIPAPEDSGVGNGCVFLDGAQAGQSSADNTRDATCLQPGDTLRFGYDWHIPFEVGNVIQGDTVTLKTGFSFMQKRHTEAPEFANIYAPGQNTPN